MITEISDNVTAVLFDWDFTLAYTIDPHISHTQRMVHLFQQHGVVCTEKELADAVAQLDEAIQQGRVQATRYPQKKREILQQYRLILEKLDHPDTSHEFAYKLYGGYAQLPHFLYDDVRPTLQHLQEKDLNLGILSNHSRSVRSVIARLVGDIILPHRVILSEEVGVHKPAKTIFQRAASKMRTSPAQCVYVGDNLSVDAIGAVEQGGYAAGVWLDRRKQDLPSDPPENVAHITTLAQLPDLL